jgi:hypothetical protein
MGDGTPTYNISNSNTLQTSKPIKEELGKTTQEQQFYQT